MSSGNLKRRRSQRVASLQLPHGSLALWIDYLRRGDVLLRIGLCLIAALIVAGVTRAWVPHFAYRAGYTPARHIVARVEFGKPDSEETNREKDRRRAEARRRVTCVYQHDPQPLVELREAVKGKVFQIVRAESYQKLDEKVRQEIFAKKPTDTAAPTPEDQQRHFETFRKALAGDEELVEFEKAIQRAFSEVERDGLLEDLQHSLEQGSQTEISVHPVGNEQFDHLVAVDDVRLGQTAGKLLAQLREQLVSLEIADRVFSWVKPRLPTTLSLNEEATGQAAEQAAEQAAKNVEPVQIVYQVGEELANGGQPLLAEKVALLKLEHEAFLKQLNFGQKLRHAMASCGMYVALYLLCGFYGYYRNQGLMEQISRLASIFVMVVLTVILCWITAPDPWRAELIPLMLFGITCAIAYERELALLLSSAVAMLVVFSLGYGLADLVTLIASMSAAILLLGRMRSRTKLIYVGLGAAVVAMLTALGTGTLTGQPLGIALLSHASWLGFCCLLTGLLMTGLLPFIESLFDVQTEISLLELGDAAHPLLQELVRRAPGTYNHSINVASMAEAAAEAIGANGLLLRVGAYFHDIGKMLKPGYFIENQVKQDNRHESLLPAMSTLVIIAHVKDGADLARQHGLPRSIIDFIQQHHGTTLVGFFYDRASKQCEDDPDASQVDETDYRYPGPKPRTKEAGVLLLADSVESACRTLVEPTPARIENLVHDIAMQRLLDGQFDECSLTLKQLHTIEDSLVKSLTAVYHSRVKYPEPQPA